VLNELRRDLAGHYLRDESLSISQVAWLLGFRNLSAFKRWNGTTPRAARTHATAAHADERAQPSCKLRNRRTLANP